MPGWWEGGLAQHSKGNLPEANPISGCIIQRNSHIPSSIKAFEPGCSHQLSLVVAEAAGNAEAHHWENGPEKCSMALRSTMQEPAAVDQMHT